MSVFSQQMAYQQWWGYKHLHSTWTSVAIGHVPIVVLELNFRLKVINWFGFDFFLCRLVFTFFFLNCQIIFQDLKKSCLRPLQVKMWDSSFGICSILGFMWTMVLLQDKEHHCAQGFTLPTTPSGNSYSCSHRSTPFDDITGRGGGDRLRPPEPWFDESPATGPEPASPLLTSCCIFLLSYWNE